MGLPNEINPLLVSTTAGYQIERSLRFNSADSAYLSRTPASTGTSRRVFTISLWLKRSALLASALDFGFINAGGDATTIGISGTGAFGAGLDNTVFLRLAGNIGNWPAVFRDTSAWYHFVVAIDSTQATAANRQKLYVNGVDQGACSGSLTQNVDTAVSHTGLHLIGAFNGPSAGYYANGYLAEYHLIDGQALTPSSFGETDTITGVWKPKKYTGTYGTNGFFLNFSDNSGTTSTTLGKDSSGNGNNWTPNNFSVTAGAGNDSLIDTPTPYADGGNGRGNYCTLNPLDNPNTTYALAQNGNLEANLGTGVGTFLAGTLSTAGGKYYWECTPTTVGNGLALGITYGSTTITDANSKAVFYIFTGDKRILGTTSSYGATYAANDVIGVAVDGVNGTIEFFKNNVSQGVITNSTISSQQYKPFIYNNTSSGSSFTLCNFGQRPFAYTPPSGFKALNTGNLPEPSIKNPGSYMDTLLWTGNGSERTITGLGFSPDLVWIKTRNASDNHVLNDAVRGANKQLFSNLTESEFSGTTLLTSFNSDGFTLGTDSAVNSSVRTYVAWCWDESATPGFDIVTYTGDGVDGRTVSHNLGVVPSFVIVKSRNFAENWNVKHKSLSANNVVFLNLTSAQETPGSGYIGDLTSSTVITLKNGGSAIRNVNGNGDTYVAYLWSEVAGFSRFGSYTGNGSADGPFVFCGFRPRWVMVKRSNASENWAITDSSRTSTNVADGFLRADESAAETSGGASSMDILSNGFKLRGTDTKSNASGSTYIFAAFAEAPFKYSLAR
jgi:hypothetical protein